MSPVLLALLTFLETEFSKEVNVPALESTVVTYELSHLGGTDFIAAIIANGPTIFPDPKVEPEIVAVLKALAAKKAATGLVPQ